MNNSIILGCILGDGYLNKYGTLTIEHSIEQSDYIYWKYAKLKELNLLTQRSQPKLVSRIHPKNKKETKSLPANSARSLFKKDAARLFYPNGIMGREAARAEGPPSNFESICTQLPKRALRFGSWMMVGLWLGNTPLGLVLDLSAYSLESAQRRFANLVCSEIMELIHQYIVVAGSAIKNCSPPVF